MQSPYIRGLGNILEDGVERLYEPEEGVCLEIMSSRNVRETAPELSPTGLPKEDLKRDDTHRHTNVEGRKPRKPQQCGC